MQADTVGIMPHYLDCPPDIYCDCLQSMLYIRYLLQFITIYTQLICLHTYNSGSHDRTAAETSCGKCTTNKESQFQSRGSGDCLVGWNTSTEILPVHPPIVKLNPESFVSSCLLRHHSSYARKISRRNCNLIFQRNRE